MIIPKTALEMVYVTGIYAATTLILNETKFWEKLWIFCKNAWPLNVLYNPRLESDKAIVDTVLINTDI